MCQIGQVQIYVIIQLVYIFNFKLSNNKNLNSMCNVDVSAENQSWRIYKCPNTCNKWWIYKSTMSRMYQYIIEKLVTDLDKLEMKMYGLYRNYNDNIETI